MSSQVSNLIQSQLFTDCTELTLFISVANSLSYVVAPIFSHYYRWLTCNLPQKRWIDVYGRAPHRPVRSWQPPSRHGQRLRPRTRASSSAPHTSPHGDHWAPRRLQLAGLLSSSPPSFSAGAFTPSIFIIIFLAWVPSILLSHEALLRVGRTGKFSSLWLGLDSAFPPHPHHAPWLYFGRSGLFLHYQLLGCPTLLNSWFLLYSAVSSSLLCLGRVYGGFHFNREGLS